MTLPKPNKTYALHAQATIPGLTRDINDMILWLAQQDRRFGVAHSLTEWEDSGRAARLAPGEYVVKHPIALRTGESIIGSGHSTILRPDPSLHSESNPVALITNADYAGIDERQAAWQCHGGAMHVQVRDLAVHGGYAIGDNPYKWATGKPDLLHGIRLNAPGSTVANVLCYAIPGEAISVKRHSSPRQGTAQLYDVTKTTITDCAVHNCYAGVSAGGADCAVHNLVAARVRDYGLKAGAACNTTLYHGWGCGIGYWTAGGTSYASIIQTENCKVAWRNDSPNPTVMFWRAFENKRLGEFSQSAIAVETHIDGDRTIEGKKLWPSRAAYNEAMKD